MQSQDEVMDIADLILSHKCPGDPLVTKPGLGLHLQMGEVNRKFWQSIDRACPSLAVYK